MAIMILTVDQLCTTLLMMDLCTDLMGSGSWILTIISVVICRGYSDLCLEPARTTVPGVSYQSSVLS